ncbi:MAG: sugar phosphate isomerase/epimerase [Planctomycetaceae bacterium]|nr:sugar phosphate isomerase/epimerase [Planctomycetaceae bacterium]
MMRLSVNELTTWRWTFDEDVAHNADEGFKAIGVSRHKLNDYGEQRGIALLRDAGLEVSNLLYVGGFTGCDGRSLDESVADGVEAIRLCEQLGASCLVVYTGGRSLHTHSHARRLVREALTQLAPLAQAHGVVLAVEPMLSECSADCSMLHTLDEAAQLLAAIKSPCVKLVLDTYHLGCHGERDAEALGQLCAQWAAQAAIVHVGDGRPPRGGEQDRCVLGEGVVPLESMLRGLLSAGYDGYFDIELMGVDIELSDYHEVIRRSKQWLDAMIGAGAA